MPKLKLPRFNLSEKGFTLVEILVTALILSLLMGGIFRVLNIGTMSYHYDMGLLDLHQGARTAMQWMLRELRESSTDDINIVAIDADDDRISLNTPNETGIQYYRDTNNNQIIREYPSGSYRILANNISSLQFSLSDQLLQIQLVANRTALNRSLSFPLEGRLYLRNESTSSSSDDDTESLLDTGTDDDDDDDDDTGWEIPDIPDFRERIR